MVEHGDNGSPSKYQLEVISEVCHQSWKDNQKIREVMIKNQVSLSDFVTYCQADLLGIAYTESRFNCSVVGDHGQSLGCMQIHGGYHPNISDDDRRDFRWSAAWTLDRLVAKGWLPRTTNGQMNRYAVQCHNSCSSTGYHQAVIAKSNQYIKEFSL